MSAYDEYTDLIMTILPANAHNVYLNRCHYEIRCALRFLKGITVSREEGQTSYLDP